MNPQQRRQLIEKREVGTLTDDEYQQYVNLLRTDSTFYDEVNLRRLLTDTLRQDADQQRWIAVSQARAEALSAATRPTRFGRVWRPPYTYAMAACVALLLLVGVWLVWTRTASDPAPLLVRTGTKEVFAAGAGPTGKAYSETAMPIGTLPVRWIEDRRQAEPLRYIYCRDTLTLFVPNRRDTVRLRGRRLLFDARTRRLLLSRRDSTPVLLAPCRPQSEPIR